MTPELITGLIIALGPAALDLIPKLTELWGKGALTADQVRELCAPAKKSVDQYIIEARSRLAAMAPTHGT